MNGAKFKIITDNGIVIAAGPDSGLLPPKFMSMSVIVYNHTSVAIDVIPSEMALEVVEPKEKTLRPIAPERVARTVNPSTALFSLRGTRKPKWSTCSFIWRGRYMNSRFQQMVRVNRWELSRWLSKFTKKAARPVRVYCFLHCRQRCSPARLSSQLRGTVSASQ
jgi:hypothetical protein